MNKLPLAGETRLARIARPVAVLTVVSFTALTTGCAELRTEYTHANGEPMYVHDETHLRSGVEQVATGQTEYRNSRGEVVGTATQYQNQVVTWEEREWFPRQGASRIDDESFYRIVGDKEAVDKYDAYHDKGVSVNHTGFIVGGIGAGLLLGGIALSVASHGTTTDPLTGYTTDTTDSGLSTVGYIGIIGGIIAAAVGITMILVGRKSAANKDARLFNDPERMKIDANKYDTQTLELVRADAPDQAQNGGSRGAGDTSSTGGGAASGIAPGPSFVFTGSGHVKKIALKEDGSVMVNGRLAGSITSGEFVDTAGTTVVHANADGTLRGDGLKMKKVRFSGDDIVTPKGTLSVDAHGAVSFSSDGISEVVGKLHPATASNKKLAAFVVLSVVISKRR